MVKEWNQWGKAEMPSERAYKQEWQRARKTMDKRRQRYGDSLRDVPLIFGNQRSRCFSVSGSRGQDTISGYGMLHVVSEQPEIIGYFHAGREECRGYDNGDMIIGGVIPTDGKTEPLDIPMQIAEAMMEARVFGKDEARDRAFLDSVKDDILCRRNTVPVKVKIGDRNIVISGDVFSVEYRVGECVQCDRPYWQFSDWRNPAADESSGGGYFPCTDGFGYWFDAQQLDHFGGFAEFLSPKRELLCGHDCQTGWLRKWDAKIKTEEDAKRFLQRYLRGQNYSHGQVSLQQTKDDRLVWWGVVGNKDRDPDHPRGWKLVDVRSISFQASDGTVIRDEPRKEEE